MVDMSADGKLECAVCKLAKTKMMRCTRCRQAYYCSRPCQIKDWPTHKIVCTQGTSLDTSIDSKDGISTIVNSDDGNLHCKEEKQVKDSGSRPIHEEQLTIIVKCNKQKIKVTINKELSGNEILQQISLTIKVQQMKLIHKGQIMNEDNIKQCIKENALFQAIGEQSENEEGLNSLDIDCVVLQGNVDRNQAVRALRRTGNVVDAILYVSNKK